MASERFVPGEISLPRPLPAVPFELTADMVRRWALGLGRDPATWSTTGLAPPFLVTGATIHLLACHFDIAGGVYWREQVTYGRPLVPGETLSIEGAVEAAYVHDGRVYVRMSSATRGRDGELAASSVSTGLHQYRREASAALGPRPAEEVTRGPDFAAGARNPARAALMALAAGEQIAGEPVTVSLEMMQALGGDDERNPIHTDPEAAKAAGLAAPIAGGPHVLAFAQLAVMDRLGDEVFSHGAHVDVRWVSPVFAGDRVTPSAVVAGSRPDVVELALEVAVEGRRAMTGRALVPVGGV